MYRLLQNLKLAWTVLTLAIAGSIIYASLDGRRERSRDPRATRAVRHKLEQMVGGIDSPAAKLTDRRVRQAEGILRR